VIVKNFGVSIRQRPKGIVGSGTEPDCFGVLVWDQAVSKRSKKCAGARDGALVGKPRWARMLAIAAGSSIAAMNFSVSAQ
jgi:hypothetical protein